MKSMIKTPKILATLSLTFAFGAFGCKNPGGYKSGGSGGAKGSAPAVGEPGQAVPGQAAPLPGGAVTPPAPVDQVQRDKASAEEFRQIFFGLGQNRFTADDLNKLVYLPTDAMLAVNAKAESPEAMLQELTTQYQSILPSELYEQGKKQSFAEVKIAPSKGPITLVVVPGIFSEFIDTYAFHEVLANEKSHLAKNWKAALSLPGKDASKMDMTYDFASEKEKSAPISDFVRMGSIDDSLGNPLVQVITLTSPSFSGESLGKIEDNANLYLRRLQKIFDVLGAPERMAIVGYSRGAIVALELVTQLEAQKSFYPWADNVKAMVSVGGVLYGAALADAAFDQKDPLNQILTRLQLLTMELELDTPEMKTTDRLALATKNTARWVKAGADIAGMALKLDFHEGLGLEKIKSTLPQFETNLGFLRTIAFNRFNFKDPRFPNYFQNIRKFKWVIAKAIEGIDSLRTTSRLNWWKTHAIPNRLTYFSIAGTMGDVSTAAKGIWPETGNRIAYAVRAVDYFALRLNYYELYRVSKLQLTDSQVSLDRSRFLPELNYKLNPAQSPFNAYYLGILGVDHWGMIFPYATRSSGDVYSPFPRDMLAHALGLHLQNYLEKAVP